MAKTTTSEAKHIANVNNGQLGGRPRKLLTISDTLARARPGSWLSLAMGELAGQPVGGWAKTAQARAAVADALPSRDDRDYTLADFLAAAFDASGTHYRLR